MVTDRADLPPGEEKGETKGMLVEHLDDSGWEM